MSGNVQVEIAGRVAVITLCKERRLNAIDLDLARGLVDAVGGLQGRDDIGAVVLRGAGQRAFCAGLDVTYAAATGDRAQAIRAISGTLDEFMAGLKALDLPSVAMLHGNCYGAGVHLAIEADFRFADEALSCAVPAIKNRLYYPVAALTRLRELCGSSRTARLLLEGEPMDAPTLLRWGLVDEVVPAAGLEAQTLAFAARLAAQPLQAVRDYRAMFSALDRGDTARAHEIRAAALARPRA
jgi:enoyl-CoA hydratase/carnithine racemase